MLLEKCSILSCTPTEYSERVTDEEDFFMTCALIKKYGGK